VVTIAVYSFFCSSLIGEQYLDPAQKHVGHSIDLYIPLSALLQLFFYIGWVKVAEALLNPFGDDDHDFEFVPLIERNWEMSKMIGEPQPNEIPPAVINIGKNLTSDISNNSFSLMMISKSNENIEYIDSNA
ncbi:chloride channel activity protein, partial [Halocaridina rubra]